MGGGGEETGISYNWIQINSQNSTNHSLSKLQEASDELYYLFVSFKCMDEMNLGRKNDFHQVILQMHQVA